MAGIVPPEYVDAPYAGPPRYGLFNAASIVELPVHGRLGGVQFEPIGCGIARPYTAECPITDQDLKTFDDGSDFLTADPFVVYATEVCAPVGRTAAEHQRRVTAKLLAGEQTVVERALWNGAGVGAGPSLTGAGATPVTSTLTGFGSRVAALEAAFYAAYGQQGTIHVNTAANGAAAFGEMLVRSDTPDIPGHLVTPLGSIWSFGAGYDITGPADAAPTAGSVWAFMTTAVTIWRSTAPLTPDPDMTFDRTTNEMYALAEREYAQSWACDTVFAIELPLEAA